MQTSEDIVKVAFIGAGQFAKLFHYSTLSTMEDVEIVAVADLNEELLNETADRYGVRGRYTDYDRMFGEEEIDAVYAIMKPHYLVPIAMDVIKAGKHLFCEKPLGVNTGETKQLAEAAQKAGIKSAVGVNRRHSRILRKAKELVEAEGPISAVLGEFHKDNKQEMFAMSTLHGDGLHVVDALRFVAGDAVSVNAHADHWYTKEGWDHSYNSYYALIRFDSGASGVFMANRQCGARREYFEIHGMGISAYVYTPERAEIYRTGIKEPEIITSADLIGSEDMLMTYGYYHENRDFIEAIKLDRVPQTNFTDHLKTMELCDRIVSDDHVEKLVH